MSGSERPPAAPPPLLVVGMHNSGTSVVAEILDERGIFMGVDAAHHENRFFRDEIAQGIVLRSADRWAQLPLPSIEEVMACEAAVREHVQRCWLDRYRALGYDGTSPWGFKDPRSCLLLPLYLAIFPGAKVLHIVRDEDDVAASLAHKRKAGVGVLADPEHWRALTRAYVERVRSCTAHSGCASLEISYEELCRDPAGVVSGVFAFAGLPAVASATGFAEERMRRDRVGTSEWGPLRWRLEAIKTAILGRG